MIKSSVDVEHILKVLNEAVALDSKAMTKIVNARSECNEALANHPTIQVGAISTDRFRVGFIGLINGLFGIDETGYGAIAAEFDEDGQLKRFVRYKS